MGDVLKWIATLTSVAQVVLPPIMQLLNNDDDSNNSSSDDEHKQDDKGGAMKDLAQMTGLFQSFQQLARTLTDQTSKRKKKQKRREDKSDRMKSMFAGDAAKRARAAENLAEEQECVIRADDLEREREKAELVRKLDELMEARDKWQARQTIERLMLQMERVLLQLGYDRKNYDNLLEQYTQQLSELSKLRRQIFNEETRLQGFEDARHDDSVMRVVLFGATGHGKSSTACRMVGDRSKDCTEGGFPVSANVKSETQTINAVLVRAEDEKVKHLEYRHNFVVIDQPGTGDTGGKEVAVRHTNRMVQYLKGVEHINCVCIVQSGMDPRLSEGTKHMLSELHCNFGDGIWKYVVLIITKVRSLYDYGGDIERGRMFLDQTEKWIIQVRREIREMFHKSASQAPLPAVAIDNMFERDYTEKCRYLINELSSLFIKDPFRCDSLVSPLDVWRSDAALKESAMRETRTALEQSISALNTLIGTVESTRMQLVQKGSDVDLMVLCRKASVDPTSLCALKAKDVFNQAELSDEVMIDLSDLDTRSDGYTMCSMVAAPPAAGARDSDDEKRVSADGLIAGEDTDRGLAEGLSVYGGHFGGSPVIGTAVESELDTSAAFMAAGPPDLDMDGNRDTGANGESTEEMDDQFNTVLQLSIHER